MPGKKLKTGTVLLSVLLLAFGIYYFSLEDPIDEAGRKTQYQLFIYALTDRPEPLRKWAGAYHGEAPTTQVMITLGSWSLKHPQEFERLLSGWKNRQSTPADPSRIDFDETFIGSIGQTSLLEKFEQTFKRSQVQEVQEILSRVIKPVGGEG